MDQSQGIHAGNLIADTSSVISCTHLNIDMSMGSFSEFFSKNTEVSRIKADLRGKFKKMIRNDDWLSCSFVDYFASLRKNPLNCYIHIFKIQTAFNCSEMKKKDLKNYYIPLLKSTS